MIGNRLKLLASACLLGVALAACDASGSPATPTAVSPTPGGENGSPTPTTILSIEDGQTPTPILTIENGQTPTPILNLETTPSASPTGGSNLQSHVSDFQVWQDFMPVVPPGGPPLHATFTLVVTDTTRYTPDTATGTMVIIRPGGEVIARSKLTLNQQSDDLGMGQPGPQNLPFVMEPASITAKLTENEPVMGEAEITLGTKQLTVTIPETRVMFTH